MPLLVLEKRAGSKALMSRLLAFPLATSSAMTLPVAGPFRMPQQECPAQQAKSQCYCCLQQVGQRRRYIWRGGIIAENCCSMQHAVCIPSATEPLPVQGRRMPPENHVRSAAGHAQGEIVSGGQICSLETTQGHVFILRRYGRPVAYLATYTYMHMQCELRT